MTGLRLPEFIIHHGVENALKFLREDYQQHETAGTINESFFSKLVGDIQFQRYSYMEQGKSVFFNGKEHQRYLEVDLMFNMSRDGAPTIHITTPAETPGQGAIGTDEGSYENELENEDTQLRSVFTRRYKGTYDIVIVSDNSGEVVFIYHVLRALLTSLIPHFHLAGLENVTFSGQDLTPYSEIVPKNFNMKAIRMNLEYETSTLSFNTNPVINGLVFSGKAVV